jgi:hypothetical protein
MAGQSTAYLQTSLDEAAAIDRVLQRNIQTPIQTDLTGVYAVTALQQTMVGNAVGGAVTYNLPSAVGIQGMRFTFKKSDASANPVNVVAAGAELIDGLASRILANQYDSISIESDGANWQVVVPTSSGATASVDPRDIMRFSMIHNVGVTGGG